MKVSNKYNYQQNDNENYQTKYRYHSEHPLIKLIVFGIWSIASIVLLILYRNTFFNNLFNYVEIDSNVVKGLVKSVNEAFLLGAKHLAFYLVSLGIGLLPMAITALINVISDKDESLMYHRGLFTVYSLVVIIGFIAFTYLMFRNNVTWKDMDLSRKILKLCFSMMFFVTIPYVAMALDGSMSVRTILFLALTLFFISFLSPLGLYLMSSESILRSVFGSLIMYGGPILAIFASLYTFMHGM